MPTNINIIKLFVNLICDITTQVLLELHFKTKNKFGEQFKDFET